MSEAPLASITFTRHKLVAFLACQRRFQLRYLQEYPWPPKPQPEGRREATRRGEQFHQLLQRHFLGLEVTDLVAGDPQLRGWWETFRHEGPLLPAGARLPEVTLTVPIDHHLLAGRFDLVVLREEMVHIYDWKTSAARSESMLREDWQTRLYLALVVEGGRALFPGASSIVPEQVALTYWFAGAPGESVTLHYDTRSHEENWAEIVDLVAQVDAARAAEELWPLTSDVRTCVYCLYQVVCGRQEAVANLREEGEIVLRADDEGAEGEVPRLEPELP